MLSYIGMVMIISMIELLFLAYYAWVSELLRELMELMMFICIAYVHFNFLIIECFSWTFRLRSKNIYYQLSSEEEELPSTVIGFMFQLPTSTIGWRDNCRNDPPEQKNKWLNCCLMELAKLFSKFCTEWQMIFIFNLLGNSHHKWNSSSCAAGIHCPSTYLTSPRSNAGSSGFCACSMRYSSILSLSSCNDFGASSFADIWQSCWALISLDRTFLLNWQCEQLGNQSLPLHC